MTRSKLATLSKIALALFWLALFAATHWPPSPHLARLETNDKVEHFVAYGTLAFLLVTTWELAVGRLNGRHLMLAWLALVVYGALDEITQIPVGRDCSFWDWTADASGAVGGLLAFLVIRKLVSQRLRALKLK